MRNQVGTKGWTARSRRVLAGTIALALAIPLGASVFVGCGKKKGDAEAAPSPGGGLDDPKNDAAVVTAAKAALACDWGTSGLKYDCPALKTWRESPLLKDGKADTTLIAMLGDAKDPVRWLAAEALANQGKTYEKDAALANQVIGASQAEKQPLIAGPLGRATGNIDAKATNLGEAMKTLAKTHAVVDYRKAIIGSMLFANRELFYDFVVDLARNDKNDDVRRAALSAPWTGTPPGRSPDSCKLWLDQVDDPKPDNGGEAAYLCAFYPNDGGCKAQWDPLLTKLETRAKGGKVQASQMSSALKYLWQQKGASNAQKDRAVAIAKALVENPANGGSPRGNALRFVAEAEGDKAKPFAKRFEGDKEFFVKSSAKDILDGKVKKL